MASRAPERAGILTIWLAILVIYNAAKGITWLALAGGIHHYAGPQVQARAFANETEEKKAEYSSAISWAMGWTLTYFGVRAAAAVSAACILLWKKLAFWCFCGASAAIFVMNIWGGDTIFEASIDLGGLAALIGLLHLAEPVAWPHLK
jgi:hypothetical protein